MTRDEAETEMLHGYLSGFHREPQPGNNRSCSFRHGWANGRDDRANSPRASSSYLHAEALKAIAADTGMSQ